VAKHTFGRVDEQIWKNVWKWARRRHPNKGKDWCKRRYFRRIGSREWVFTPPKGEGTLRLARTSDTPIRRHIKIRKDANPFDPAWTEYFEKRERLKKTDKGRISPLDDIQDPIQLCETAGNRIRRKPGLRKA
jgi:RNA-directed DNA polymerase